MVLSLSIFHGRDNGMIWQRSVKLVKYLERKPAWEGVCLEADGALQWWSVRRLSGGKVRHICARGDHLVLVPKTSHALGVSSIMWKPEGNSKVPWQGAGKGNTVKLWVHLGLVLYPKTMLLEANKPSQRVSKCPTLAPSFFHSN